MKYGISFLTLFCISISCLNNNIDKTLSGPPEFKKVRREAIKVAIDHVKAQMQDTKKKVLDNGAMVFSGRETEYMVDPASITTGDIDGDTRPDAIITLYIFRDLKLIMKEHLILIKDKKGKLTVSKVLEGEMKFISIKDGEIFVETSKVDPDSPYYGCSLCKETYRYVFTAGDLIKVKQDLQEK